MILHNLLSMLEIISSLIRLVGNTSNLLVNVRKITLSCGKTKHQSRLCSLFIQLGYYGFKVPHNYDHAMRLYQKTNILWKDVIAFELQQIMSMRHSLTNNMTQR